MIKVLLWKMGLSLLDLLRLIGQTFEPIQKLPLFAKTTNYFCFGANLDEKTLDQRGVKVFSQQGFLLEDFRLDFNHYSAVEKMGFADIYEHKGSQVWGKIYKISLLDSWRMDYFEAMPFLGKHVRRSYWQGDNDFYFYQATDRGVGLMPATSYRDKILRAAKADSLCPKRYIDWLEQLPTKDDLCIKRYPRFVLSCYPKKEGWFKELLAAYDRRAMRLFMQLYPYRTYKIKNR